MNKKKLGLFLITLPILIFGINLAHAQLEPDQPVPEIINYLIGFITFPVAGIFYSSSGWIKKLRTYLGGDPESKLDYQKMGKSAAIGVILGIGAFIWSTYDGNTISVMTPQEFFIQVGINTSVILLVDKWILGRAESPPTPETEPNFPDFPPLDELEDLIAHADEDRPVEVPLAKDTPPPPVAPANIAPESTFYLADRSSWNRDPKTIGGQKVFKIATQESRRNKRTIHVYHIQNTGIIVYNRSRDGVYFMRIAIRPENMKNFYDVFVTPPLTEEDKAWLSRNDYVLVS